MTRMTREINLRVTRLHRADIPFMYTHAAMLEGQRYFVKTK